MEELVQQLTDSKKLEKMLKTHQVEVVHYTLLLMAVLFVWHFLSDGDFSFLLTFASLISLGSFTFIARDALKNRENVCQGVSCKMLEIYLILSAARMLAILPFEGYLPFDKTGDWFYQAVEMAQLLVCGGLVYVCRVACKEAYDGANDTFDYRYMVGGAAVIALFLQPRLAEYYPADVAWAFALYAESVACVPQLFMLNRAGVVHSWTAHFLAAQFFTKVCCFVFWIISCVELQDPEGKSNLMALVGYWVLTVQGFQMLVMSDFVYQYVRCRAMGKPMAQIVLDVV